jgi:hypothetical protein
MRDQSMEKRLFLESGAVLKEGTTMKPKKLSPKNWKSSKTYVLPSAGSIDR